MQVPVWWSIQGPTKQGAAAGPFPHHCNTRAPVGLCQHRRGQPEQGECGGNSQHPKAILSKQYGKPLDIRMHLLRLTELHRVCVLGVCMFNTDGVMQRLSADQDCAMRCCAPQISMLILDEADRMLDMGFEPQIRELLSFMPGEG